MIDLSKLDPGLLYELGEQLKEAFSDMVTFDMIKYEWGTAYWWTTRVGSMEDGNYVWGTDEDIIEALRKLQVNVAAAEEKMEAGNGDM